jgi:hypothetical protein
MYRHASCVWQRSALYSGNRRDCEGSAKSIVASGFVVSLAARFNRSGRAKNLSSGR